MGTVIAIVVVLVVVAAIAAIVLRRRSSSAPDPSASISSSPTPKVRPPEKPMDGLESALAAVTDRDGRPMRERIDAESDHVDELRVPDDTGPLLRRALDHVASGDTSEKAQTGDEAAGTVDDVGGGPDARPG